MGFTRLSVNIIHRIACVIIATRTQTHLLHNLIITTKIIVVIQTDGRQSRKIIDLG